MSNQTAKLVKDIFYKNWNDEFIIDGINHAIFTYEEFWSIVINIKKTFDSLQLQKGDIIVSLMTNSVETVGLYFASLLSGVTILALDVNKGKKEKEEILNQADYKIIISNIHTMDFEGIINFRETFGNVLTISKIDKKSLDYLDDVNYDDLFSITFTSGSTGIPKGVMHSFNNYVESSINFNNKFNFGRKNIFYHNLPMSYIGGILNLIILPFISESKIVLGKQFDISDMMNFWEIPIKYSVNTFWFLPTVLTLLLKIDRNDIGIKYSKNNKIIGLVGTAPLHNELKKKFEEKYQIPLFESYCLSETFFVTTNFPQSDKSNSPGTILECVDVSFSSENEILVKSPSMFLGYLGIDTSKYFSNDEYFTGDLGKIDEEGFLHITGRKKDLIIRGGMNLSPKRIEDFITNFELFDEHTVIGIPDEIFGEKIVCIFVKQNDFQTENLKILNSKIIEELGKDHKIDEFIQIEQIPKTNTGKVDKPKLRLKYSKK